MQEDVQALLQKYKQKLTEQLNIPTQPLLKPVWSREYQQFKHEYLPKHLSLYEKLCSFAGNLLKIK
ncbi:MAG: hypothetical protein QXH80_05220, partial [Candidatus Nanoarchaeia archaeon]